MTADLKLRSARSLSPGERAAVFNAAYDGYFLPFHVDEQQLASMDDAFDLDLDASRIAFRDGEPVGLGNLGLRGEDSWIGGVGVVASSRRSGVGEAIMRALHEEARKRGARRVWLEVIVENTGAHALYEKLGYELAQDVEVWTLPGAEGEHAGREVPVAEARERLAEPSETSACSTPGGRSGGCRVPRPRRLGRRPPARDAARPRAVAPLQQVSGTSPAAAKRRDTASSVAPIASAIEAPCVLASLAFRAPGAHRHSLKGH